eukprot:Skav226439  [mRNA]  locus=scaffold2660:52835:53389:+ [translate_table: standard]
MLCFDCAYTTCGLNHLLLEGKQVLVGGVWTPTHPDNAAILLDDKVDVRHVKKSTQMMEMLAWDPSLGRKVLSCCSIPIENNFGGVNSGQRAGLYMLDILGRVLQSCDDTVKSVCFDAATFHQLLRKCMHGQLQDVNVRLLEDIPFFSEIRHFPLPPSVLPRVGIQFASIRGEVIWAIPGVCCLD